MQPQPLTGWSAGFSKVSRLNRHRNGACARKAPYFTADSGIIVEDI